MKRDISVLSNSPYDLLVIGGGIYGAWIAWDAALRGLSVALVDKGDFASATSSNSLKIIHGGFRYLQHADFRRMRQSIRERRDLMKVAPHLVHPLPVLIPSYGSWMQRKELMALALAMNDLMAMDRNRLQDPQKHITRGRVLSRQEVERLVPDVPSEGLSGGLVFHDAQVYSSERLVISVLRSAAGAGAALDNYVEVTSLLKDGNSVAGVVAHDVLTGDRFEVRARMTVNATGPWSERLLGLLGEHYQNDTTPAVKAVNLVTRRLVEGYAVGVASANGYRDAGALISRSDKFLFIAPWRGYSLIGTTYTSFDGHPDRLEVTPGDVEDLLQKFNRAWPSARLGFDDVSFVHCGLLPGRGGRPASVDVQLAKHSQVRDHGREGIPGLISVTGVKYTLARQVAEKAVDLVFRLRGQKAPSCATDNTPVHGGDIVRFQEFLRAEAGTTFLPPEGTTTYRLLHNYGSAYRRVLAHLDEESLGGPWWSNDLAVWKAEVRHGVREEMAQKLVDIVFRRTELGTAGHPGKALLMTCAETMGAELGWSNHQLRQELQEVEQKYPALGVMV